MFEGIDPEAYLAGIRLKEFRKYMRRPENRKRGDTMDMYKEFRKEFDSRN